MKNPNHKSSFKKIQKCKKIEILLDPNSKPQKFFKKNPEMEKVWHFENCQIMVFWSKPQEFFKRNPEIFQNLFPELKEKYFFKTFGINFNIFLTSTIHIINNAKQNWIQKFRNNWFYVIVYSPCFVSLVTLQVHYTQINLHSFYISSHVCVCGNWSYNFFFAFRVIFFRYCSSTDWASLSCINH